MKKGIHPENYRLVAFKDMSNNDVFITKSAVETKDSISVDGIDYPLVKLEISRTSHPYYTGKTKLVDTAGRIDKFKNRYANVSLKSKQSPVEEAPVARQWRGSSAEEGSSCRGSSSRRGSSCRGSSIRRGSSCRGSSSRRGSGSSSTEENSSNDSDEEEK